YPIDRERIYVLGHSLGGMTAAKLTWESERIAAAVCIAGAGHIRARLPALLIAGELDPMIPPSRVRPYASGKEVIYDERKGLGHTLLVADVLDDAVAWLLSKSRKPTAECRIAPDLPHGVVALDKPAGLSSARALVPLKALLGAGTKVGHAGTLDPFATGLLLALLGDATRLSDLAMSLPKTYRARVRFGVETDTLDPEGEVVAREDPGAAAPSGLAMAASRLVGEIEQVPPAYSALKVKGRRAYALARKGRAPELRPRRVQVHSLEVREVMWPEVDLEVVCGQGTYVRSLARDLGRELRLPASLTALRRTRIGSFAQGYAPDEVSLSGCLPPLGLVEAAGVPVLEVTRPAALRFAQGRGIEASSLLGQARFAVLCEGELVGLGQRSESGIFPETVLAGARRRLEGRE
ncbi:MAG: tRNA pseudouridine(55) synthase TruB, partial [Planctomycetota bacterium]